MRRLFKPGSQRFWSAFLHVLAWALALTAGALPAGCASLNGNGLIGAGGGRSTGCYTIHDAGQAPRTICVTPDGR